MSTYEVICTGGGIWLSLLHKKVGFNRYTYCVESDFKTCLSCYKDIGSDYEFYEENMVFSYDRYDARMQNEELQEIYKELLKQLENKRY